MTKASCSTILWSRISLGLSNAISHIYLLKHRKILIMLYKNLPILSPLGVRIENERVFFEINSHQLILLILLLLFLKNIFTTQVGYKICKILFVKENKNLFVKEKNTHTKKTKVNCPTPVVSKMQLLLIVWYESFQKL